MQPIKRAVVLPAAEIMVQRAARGQVLWECTPLAAGVQQTPQFANHLTDIDRSLVAASPGTRDLRVGQLPSRIGQVVLGRTPSIHYRLCRAWALQAGVFSRRRYASRTRAYPDSFREDPCQVALIGKAALQRDFPDRHRGLLQQVLGTLHPLGEQPSVGWEARALLERPLKWPVERPQLDARTLGPGGSARCSRSRAFTRRSCSEVRAPRRWGFGRAIPP